MERNILKIVVTGPESSGKTLLAKALADSLQVPCVPEFARYYVAHLGRKYVQDDLITIYRGQQAWENWFLQKMPSAPSPPCLVCDTDWTVVRIWEKYGYKTPSVLPATSPWEQYENFFYLLCTPDFPWQPDPLREHPKERWQLFELYQALLIRRKLPFHILRGGQEDRLQSALEVLRGK